MFFSFMNSNLLICFLMYHAFGIISEKYFLIQVTKIFSYILFYKFHNFRCYIMSINHLKLMFSICFILLIKVLFCIWISTFHYHLWKKIPFLCWLTFISLLKISYLYSLNLFLVCYFIPFIYLSICIPIAHCLDYSGFTVSLEITQG